MNPQPPLIAIGGQLPPIHWLSPKTVPAYRHKTYFELRREGTVTPYYRFNQWVNLDRLPLRYYYFEGERERVALSEITPTQPMVLKRVVAHYITKKRLTDDSGRLPHGIRFADSDAVYLTDGHHRLEAARRLGRTHLRMIVETYPLSLEKAMRGSEPCLTIIK